MRIRFVHLIVFGNNLMSVHRIYSEERKKGIFRNNEMERKLAENLLFYFFCNYAVSYEFDIIFNNVIYNI